MLVGDSRKVMTALWLVAVVRLNHQWFVVDTFLEVFADVSVLGNIAAYLVVADEEFGRQIPFAFLERIKDDFKRRYQGGKADMAVAHSLDREFGYEDKFDVAYSLDKEFGYAGTFRMHFIKWRCN